DLSTTLQPGARRDGDRCGAQRHPVAARSPGSSRPPRSSIRARRGRTVSPTNSLPSAPDLIRRIANRLPRAVTYGGQASGPDAVPDYDIYEAYLFSLIVGVAQDMGYAVDYLTSDLTSATTLHFRRKPAPIY